MGDQEFQDESDNITGLGTLFNNSTNEYDDKKLPASSGKSSLSIRARGKMQNSHSDDVHTADCQSISLQWPFPQWRNELSKKHTPSLTLQQLHARDGRSTSYVHILLDNPVEEDDNSTISVTGFELLTRQFTLYKKKNAKKLKLLILVFCLAILALFATMGILIYWASKQGTEKYCNSFMVSDAASLESFLKRDCTEVKELDIVNMAGIITAPSLVTVGSIIITGSSANDTFIVFPNLVNVTGSVRIEHNQRLREISMPQLVFVTADVILRNNSKLTQLDLSSLASARNVLVENSNTTDITLSSLHTVTSNLKLYRVSLNSFNAPNLKYAGDEVVIEYVFPPSDFSMGRAIYPVLSSTRLNAILRIAMPQLQQAGSLALRHVHGLESIAFPALQSVGQLDINGISYRYEQAPDTVEGLLNDQHLRDSLTFPLLHVVERLQIKYCSGLYSVEMPSLHSVGEINIEANPDLLTFELNFVKKPTRENPQVNNVVFLLNSRLVRIALVNLHYSQQSISLYGNTALQDLQLESLGYMQTFAIMACTSLSHLRLPSLRCGSLLVAENKALTTVEAPNYQKGTTLFIFDNPSLKNVLLPELISIEVSKNFVDVPWLFSSVVGFMPENVINGLILFQGNTMLPRLHLPKLTTCGNALFLYQAQDFDIATPALSNITRLVLVGHVNVTSAEPEGPKGRVLSLPSLVATTIILVYRTLIDYMLFPRLQVSETFALAQNPQLKDVFAPVLSWPITEPALVCYENNRQFCASTPQASGFPPSNEVTTYRNCYVKNGPNSTNQTCPGTDAVRADCCDQAIIKVSTGPRQCSANYPGKCRDLLDHVNQTASHVLTIIRYNSTL